MESRFNTGTLTSITKEIVDEKPNNLPKEAQNIDTREISTPTFMKGTDIKNGSILVEVKEEPEDQPHLYSMEHKIMNTSMLKKEPEWDHFDTKIIPEIAFIHEEDKLEPIFIVQFEGTVVKESQEDNKAFLDISSKIPGPTFNGFQDFTSKEIDVETLSEIGKSPKITFDEWKIKSEEVDIKEEALGQNEFGILSGGSDQVKDVHGKMYKCQMCNYQTMRKIYFNRHMSRHGGSTFKCGKCSFKTIYKSSLKPHLLLHEKPEAAAFLYCDKCPYKTLRKCILKIHRSQHKDLKKVVILKCPDCEYKTIEKSGFKRHLLRHQDPRDVDMFSCNKCPCKTNRKQSLKAHLVRHCISKDIANSGLA